MGVGTQYMIFCLGRHNLAHNRAPALASLFLKLQAVATVGPRGCRGPAVGAVAAAAGAVQKEGGGEFHLSFQGNLAFGSLEGPDWA